MPKVIIEGKEVETSLEIAAEDEAHGIKLEFITVMIETANAEPVKVQTIAKVQNSPHELILDIDSKHAARQFFQINDARELKALVGIRVPNWGIVYTSAEGFRKWSKDPVE